MANDWGCQDIDRPKIVIVPSPVRVSNAEGLVRPKWAAFRTGFVTGANAVSWEFESRSHFRIIFDYPSTDLGVL